MRFKKIAVLVNLWALVFFAALLQANSLLAAPERTTSANDWLDTKTPVKWLVEGSYEKLERHLDDLYKEVKKRPGKEYRLVWTYMALSRDAQNEPHILRWEKARASRYQMKIAFAGILNTKASDIRQAKLANKVSREDFERIHKLHAEARGILEAVLKEKPDHPVALYYYIGTCASEKHCLPEEMARVEEHAPHAYFARRAIFNFLQPKWGGSMALIESYQKTLQKNLKINPHWKPLMGFDQFALCGSEQLDREYEKAFPYCRKAWAFGPDLFYLDAMSWAASKLGFFSEFRGYVDEFRRLFPSDYYEKEFHKYAKAMLQWGNYFRKENPSSAMEAFTEAQKIAPDFDEPYVARAKLYYAQENLPAAENDIKKAVALNPDNLHALEWFSFVLGKQRRTHEMISLWNNYIERHPEEPKAYYEVAKGYFSKKDFKSTYENVQKACSLGHEKSCEWETRLKTQSSPQP
ncbi:MAG: hypothetical protein LBI35_02880 [Burkholderiales bacterium]|jgi:tetratricopeptide (TPR) repeat protein|nr:hypothetical protein [Burkholderiales bacterium]